MDTPPCLEGEGGRGGISAGGRRALDLERRGRLSAPQNRLHRLETGFLRARDEFKAAKIDFDASGMTLDPLD
jgi:hypothetical protein